MLVKKDVSLEEAVQLFQTLPKELFLWETKSVIDVKNYFGETVFSTVVTCFSTKNVYSVAVFLNGQRNHRLRTNFLGTFENLEELRKKFPRLFEVSGDLNTN